jgi:hypothetical protein
LKQYNDNNWGMMLRFAKANRQSSTVLQVLEEILKKKEYDLQNHIGIPKIVTIHGVDNVRRIEILQLLLYNSPKQIDGNYRHYM